MKKDFEDMLVDLANGEIDDEEAQEIIEEINDMRKEEDEDEE
jgi:hydrogenase maturation factor